VIAALRAGIRDFVPKAPGFLDELPIRVGRMLEQTRLERALRHSEERYRRVLTTANEGIWLLDSDSRITYVNARMAELLGYAPGELIGRHSWEFAAPEDRPRFDELFERRRNGLFDQVDLRFRHRDGRDLWLILAGRPIQDERGAFQGALDMFTDVTDRKRAEDEVRRLNAELEGRVVELQNLLGRLQDTDRRKDEFLAMLGHELRNPLAAITNAVQVLRLIGSSEPRLSWARDVIQRQAESLARMLDDLLDISRIDRGAVTLHMERVELAVIVAQALETCRHAVDAKHQRLHVRLLPDPVLLDADITRLTQVIANLLSNATKFTPDGGEIWLDVEREDDHVRVRVRDTGIGIEAPMLPRVFDLFAQADQSHGRSFGGLGVGLTLVERLVTLHRGTVDAHSAGLNQGSTFEVRLPVATGTPAPRAKAAPTRRRSKGGPLRVLVVDDDADVGEGTTKLLELLGNQAGMVTNGRAALEAVAMDTPDVVLIDIGMPEMDGYELVRRLRAEPGGSALVLIAVTGYGQPEDRKRTREAGFDAHLVKPVTVAMLETLLDGIRTRYSRPGSGAVVSDITDRSR
jgi:two-component system CheB/CheR fusion protein